MPDLYRQNGGAPAELPFEAFTADGQLRTDLANHPDSAAECGFALAPPKPDDTFDEIAVWNSVAETWVMIERPLEPELPSHAEVFLPITPRQFFQALALPPYGLITSQEALDAVKTGEIPAVMQDVIDGLPADAQFNATMLVAGGQQFNRDDPLVAIFGASQDMDAAAIDAFWRFARSL
ncbi:hypothetical protein [Aureimonas phyllosphaerae]|uniref:Uncharacterized protein n=1 Tax=Aureimonas phyllosphaerae TaxID=1166078 RepID=A0A7W6BTU4_9HYPH|nr:hypothetical protein [Aureimonas phyllosphaerae]MBB3937941.1 hypothetical protein [Aureimonas phyllosphaerae]MBB3961886.1 hypothetical protein [Aureimonas phyllosphaerae]SFF54454.1 hypothetical protein SAMN05216566_12514 [Aureimonas phyllosphaerae]